MIKFKEKLTDEEEEALNKVREKLFEKYSVREYRLAFRYVMKHRKEYKTDADVKFAVDNYLRENHDKNKCWKNKL